MSTRLALFCLWGALDAPTPLGSNIVLTDDNQNVLVRYEYDVFGAIRNQTGTSDNTRKFTGKEFDADSNLYYYGARYYDPYIGRFTQRDPIADGINWYAYTYNNPLKFVDPTGMRSLTPTEKAKAKDFFGDIDVNLDDVTIHKHPKEGVATTIYNKILYDETKGSISQELLIHELVHVWQYKHVNLDLLGAAVTQVTGMVIDHEELYDYEAARVGDPDRKTLREYSFEEQAAIIQDAYRVTVMGIAPKHNKDYEFLSDAELWQLYKLFMAEFAQWNQEELQQSNSTSHLDDN